MGPLPESQTPGAGGQVLTFKPANVLPESRDLLHLADKVGGDFGVLAHAGEQHQVLRVQDGLFAAASKPSPGFRAALEKQEWDLHPVLKNADAGFFLASYRRFLNA